MKEWLFWCFLLSNLPDHFGHIYHPNVILKVDMPTWRVWYLYGHHPTKGYRAVTLNPQILSCRARTRHHVCPPYGNCCQPSLEKLRLLHTNRHCLHIKCLLCWHSGYVSEWVRVGWQCVWGLEIGVGGWGGGGGLGEGEATWVALCPHTLKTDRLNSKYSSSYIKHFSAALDDSRRAFDAYPLPLFKTECLRPWQ